MRVGIMSIAHLHADAYIGNLRTNPDVEFIGFSDTELPRSQTFADNYNTKHYATHEALLAESPDAVIVCSENARHRPLVELAANAGVHILCEKPLATTLADAKAVVDVCTKNNVTLMTAFPLRFSPTMIEVKNLLDSGRFGQVYGCNATNQGECPKHHRAWFVDKELAGGGAAMDHIVHLTDILRWFFECEVVEVYAEFNHILYAAETDVETGRLVMLMFENGAFASIDTSWSKPPYYPTWGGLKLELVGANGLVTADAFKQMMTVYSHKKKAPAFNFWGSNINQAMIDDFVAAIQEQRPPKVTGYDGLKAVEVVLAAYRSAELGEPVRLPLAD
jgi:predicted dehydrogenase